MAACACAGKRDGLQGGRTGGLACSHDGSSAGRGFLPAAAAGAQAPAAALDSQLLSRLRADNEQVQCLSRQLTPGATGLFMAACMHSSLQARLEALMTAPLVRSAVLSACVMCMRRCQPERRQRKETHAQAAEAKPL
jgi:hypothetical protein